MQFKSVLLQGPPNWAGVKVSEGRIIKLILKVLEKHKMDSNNGLCYRKEPELPLWEIFF